MAQRTVRTAGSQGIGPVVNEAPWCRFPSLAVVIARMGFSTIAYGLLGVLIVGTMVTWIGAEHHQMAQVLFGLIVFSVAALAGCHLSAEVRPSTISSFVWASRCWPTGSGHGVVAGTSYGRT